MRYCGHAPSHLPEEPAQEEAPVQEESPAQAEEPVRTEDSDGQDSDSGKNMSGAGDGGPVKEIQEFPMGRTKYSQDPTPENSLLSQKRQPEEEPEKGFPKEDDPETEEEEKISPEELVKNTKEGRGRYSQVSLEDMDFFQ